MNRYYPKVLIIGNTFHSKSGGGITMTNLFKGWPKDNLAVATTNIEMSDNEICKNYYRLGEKEDVRPVIFNLFRNRKSSGPIKITTNLLQMKENKITFPRYFSLLIHSIVEKFLIFMGLYHFVYQLKISDQFLEWLNDFKPDVIYAQVSKLSLVQFINEIYSIVNIPYSIHVMDDHYKTMIKGGLLRPYWDRILKREYRTLLENAYVRISISDAMSEEYLQRFNQEFKSFHNPIKKERWMKFTKHNWEANNPFIVMYAGRVGIGTEKSLIDISKAIEELVKEGYNIKLNIQLNMNAASIQKTLSNYHNTFISNSINYEHIPRKLSEADLLVLPIDFDYKSIKYIKYSMPTKTSEFMITGIPILVYAPTDTALAKYAKKYAWGYLVDNNNVDQLKEAIRNLATNEELRKAFGKRARELALEKHDAEKVCEEFRKTLSKITE